MEMSSELRVLAPLLNAMSEREILNQTELVFSEYQSSEGLISNSHAKDSPVFLEKQQSPFEWCCIIGAPVYFSNFL